MNSTNIEHVLTSAFGKFLDDLSPKKDDEVSEKMKTPIGDMFKNQAKTDEIKRKLGDLFKPAMRVYFERFLLGDRVDFKRLKYGVVPYQANIMRRIGKEKLNFILLLVEVDEAQTKREGRRGLVLGDVS